LSKKKKYLCYIGYELNIANDSSASQHIFTHAIHVFSWWVSVF